MKHKSVIIFVCLALVTLSFVSAANYPGDINVVVKAQNEKDCWENACSDKYGECYPYGGVKEGKFCAEDYEVRDDYGRIKYTAKNMFVEQVELGENCSKDFECLTNFCLGNICTNKTEEFNRQVDVKIDAVIEELKQNLSYTTDKDKEDIFETEDKEISPKRNIFEKIFGWLKNLFP